jgi:dihydroorotase
VERNIRLSEETGCRLHICHISTKESVQLIRDAKASGIKVTTETAPHYLLLNEGMLQEDGCWKMNPPIRSVADQMALLAGVQDGTIDVIATDHAPHTREEKAQDFTKAPSGMTGLETALALGITNLVDAGHIDLTKLIQLMSTNPARLYGLEAGELSPGFPADIVIFDPGGSWTVRAEDFRSRSVNSPFVGAELKGRVRYTVCSGKIVYQA